MHKHEESLNTTEPISFKCYLFTVIYKTSQFRAQSVLAIVELWIWRISELNLEQTYYFPVTKVQVGWIDFSLDFFKISSGQNNKNEKFHPQIFIIGSDAQEGIKNPVSLWEPILRLEDWQL